MTTWLQSGFLTFSRTFLSTALAYFTCRRDWYLINPAWGRVNVIFSTGWKFDYITIVGVRKPLVARFCRVSSFLALTESTVFNRLTYEYIVCFQAKRQCFCNCPYSNRIWDLSVLVFKSNQL